MAAGSVNYLTESSIWMNGSRALPGSRPLIVGRQASAVDAVEALFGPVADDAPVFRTPLVLHAERPGIGIDVGAAGLEVRKVAALADHAPAGVRFRAPFAAEIRLARLRIDDSRCGQRADQQKLFHVSSPGLAAQCVLARARAE